MAGQTQIGAIHVEASIGTAEYIAGSKKIKAETASLERDVKTRFAGITGAVKGGIAGLVGALSIGAITQIGRAALQYAASLGEVSQQLGVTTRDLQTLRYAAGQLGVSQSELDKGLENLTKTLGKVAVGAEKPAKALEAIGLNAQQVAQMNTGDAFRAIADALEKVTDRAQRAAVETALFGEQGAKLDTMLAGGSSALNELANAAETLGIVLSDEQIQKADETADKLEALKTVLQAQIAGIVADNADSILGFADAIGTLVNAISSALGYLRAFREALASIDRNFTSLPELILGREFSTGGKPKTGAQRFGGLFKGKPAAPRGVDVGDFLAKAPRAGRTPRTRTGRTPRDDSARDLFRFEQDELRAQMDILRSKQQLATDYVERTTLGVQILDLEKQSYAENLKFQVSQKDLTQAQADRLMLLYNEKDALEREALVREERARGYEDSVRLDAVTLDLQQEALESQLQLATTAAEQRDLQLRLLDLSYRQEKARLEAVLADEQASEAAKEEARRRLLALNSRYEADRQGVINNTRNPLEEWAASVPQTAKEITEAFQRIQADGLENLSDALADVITGTKSLKEAAHEMAASFIADTIRMITRMLLLKAITSAFGGFGGSSGGGYDYAALGDSGLYDGLPAFATGGSFNVQGRAGSDRNVLALNGLPIARVSHGERVNISNDNDGAMMSPMTLTMHNDFRGVDASSVARVEAKLEQLKAELPGTIVGTVQDARSRFIIRG